MEVWAWRYLYGGVGVGLELTCPAVGKRTTSAEEPVLIRRFTMDVVTFRSALVGGALRGRVRI